MTSIANTGFWIGIVGVSQVAPILTSSPLKISGTLLMFASVCFILFLYILLLIPETKVSGRIFKAHFSKRVLLHVHGKYCLKHRASVASSPGSD